MKTLKTGPSGHKLKSGVAVLAVTLGGMLASNAVFATSAGTVLRNSVTVTYTDAANTLQAPETATVDVIVDHVPSAAWGAVPTGQTVQSAGAISPDYTVTLTNTGNGSDSYTITDNTVEACTTGTLSAASFSYAPSLTPTLGATITAAAGVFGGVNTTIPVSNLIAADFSNGDIVIINGNSYTVDSVVDNASPATDDLVVVGDATADATGAGIQIGEQITFTISGNAGTLSAGATGCTHTHDYNALGTDPLNGNAVTNIDTGTWVTTVEGVALTVNKYVRNDTNVGKNPVFNAVTDITYNGIEYYASGVTGNPTDILTYVVVIDNASAGDASNVIFTDSLPTFTTIYNDGSNDVIELDTNGDETFDVAVGTAGETIAASDGAIVLSGSTLTVYAGTSGSDTTSTGGGVAAAAKTAVRYQITID